MANFKIFLVFLLFLLSGDFIATFFYHVPEHIFGQYHALIHHSSNRSFIYYALVNKSDPGEFIPREYFSNLC